MERNVSKDTFIYVGLIGFETLTIILIIARITFNLRSWNFVVILYIISFLISIGVLVGLVMHSSDDKRIKKWGLLFLWNLGCFIFFVLFSMLIFIGMHLS